MGNKCSTIKSNKNSDCDCTQCVCNTGNCKCCENVKECTPCPCVNGKCECVCVCECKCDCNCECDMVKQRISCSTLYKQNYLKFYSKIYV